MREKPGHSESPFCRNCTRDDCPTNGDGCKAWETYFIDNWNKNIMKLWKNHKKQRQFFRYEHPDLVREGIVFEHEQGENVRLSQAGENKAFSNAFVSAQKSGALEVTVNGKTYRRANRRSSTWRPV